MLNTKENMDQSREQNDFKKLNNETPSKLIKQFQLSRHPEGGWFREIIRSDLNVLRNDGKTRRAITGIIFLLTKGEQSKWHRVNYADEIWVYLQGAPLTLWQKSSEENQSKKSILNEANPMILIPAGHWQAASSQCHYTLTSCFVGPGFEFSDFEML